MKKTLFLLSLLTLSLQYVTAQITPCSRFSVTGFSQDTINPNQYLIHILFTDSPDSIVYYPNILWVLNQTGDTIADGSLFFFGQLGQTEQGYPVTPRTSFDNGNLSALFVYGTDGGISDTCLLLFALPTYSPDISAASPALVLSPNPASSAMHIHPSRLTENIPFIVTNTLGEMLHKGVITHASQTLDLTHYPAGIYFLHTEGQAGITRRFIKK